MLLTLVGIGSLAILIALAVFDPKRNARFRDRSWVTALRRILFLLLLLPGIPVTMQGGLPHFFVWVGAVSMAGWLVALAANYTGNE